VEVQSAESGSSNLQQQQQHSCTGDENGDDHTKSSEDTDSLTFMFSGKERVVAKTQNISFEEEDESVDQHARQQHKNGKNKNHNELDWVLTNYDERNSEPQSLEEELRRLQTLRSYLVLDSEREHQFERLTALASRILDVPIALVSLVDLGRQWFVRKQ
jgi:hypothetical protein